MRTARIGLRPTRGQRRRLYSLLATGGDVWAAVIELNRYRLAKGAAPIVGYTELCREIAGVDLGELDMTGARSVVRRYSAGWFESNKRKRRGERACYPRRRRRLMPLRWYHGTFALDGDRVRIPVARGCPPLRVRLARTPPYPAGRIRSVTLVAEAGKLWLDVTAAIAVRTGDPEPGKVAGVDLGIIHPYAAATDGQALVVSGRAVRAESRLHLDDTTERARRLAGKRAGRGRMASRRVRQLRRRQRRAEVTHRRRLRQAHHQAAATVIAWASRQRVGTLVVGDAKGICDTPAGRVHNLRLRQWRRTHLMRVLHDKAEEARIAVVTLDERGTSSTCPDCRKRTPKPTGRTFVCPHCGHQGHRDVVGARNIAAKHSGGTVRAPARTQHRRAGTAPARRDRRRHLYDQRRRHNGPARLRAAPPPAGWESLATTARTTQQRRARHP